ncbi:ribosome-recycling factor, partial [Vibrio parahaemolyticus]
LEFLAEELKSIRTGRANVAMLDGIMVESYGALQPLKAVASISAPDAKTLAVTPWDKSAMPAILTAIRENASLGLNPMHDGTTVRMNIPPLT